MTQRETNRGLCTVFERSARRHLDHTAVELSSRRLSYERLRQAAEVVAESIVATHNRVRRVGLLASRSAVAYARHLAALRLGAQVPLRLDYPAQHNLDICELADVTVSPRTGPATACRERSCVDDVEAGEHSRPPVRAQHKRAHTPATWRITECRRRTARAQAPRDDMRLVHARGTGPCHMLVIPFPGHRSVLIATSRPMARLFF
jgi:non-ribosomal peptide synthetase component F